MSRDEEDRVAPTPEEAVATINDLIERLRIEGVRASAYRWPRSEHAYWIEFNMDGVDEAAVRGISREDICDRQGDNLRSIVEGAIGELARRTMGRKGVTY